MTQLILKNTGDILTDTSVKVIETEENCYFLFGTYSQTSIAAESIRKKEKCKWTYFRKDIITDSIQTVVDLEMAILEYATKPHNVLINDTLKMIIINAMSVSVPEGIVA